MGLQEYKVASDVDFSNLTLTEAVLTLDRNPNTKKIADWLCELASMRNTSREIIRLLTTVTKNE